MSCLQFVVFIIAVQCFIFSMSLIGRYRLIMLVCFCSVFFYLLGLE